MKFLRRMLYVILSVPLAFLVLHTAIRIVRKLYRFPMPEGLANLIDNPMRHRLQPPEKTPARHGIAPGMKVLEVGPGNGTYTVATARHVGGAGRVVAIDIEPRMVERVRRRVEEEGVENVEARVASVYDLPFSEGSFDAAYMIAVIGEIPQPGRAVREIHRVLKPGGTLALSELLLDPDYSLAGTLVRLVLPEGFRLKEWLGNPFYYTLIFEKAVK